MIAEDDSSAAEVASTHAPTTIPEEPTPISPASPDLVSTSLALADTRMSEGDQPSEQPTKQYAGRFIKNISTDGSRASAEDNAQAEIQKQAGPSEGGIPEMEMRAVRKGSNVFRRNSKKQNAKASASDLNRSVSQSTSRAAQKTPSTDGSTKSASPHWNDLSSPSADGGRHAKSFKKIKGERADTYIAGSTESDDGDYDDETHPILAALYPLTNFIGYRPLSHPHTPVERRRKPGHPQFNRFHYICGCTLTFGLDRSGETGELARYRDPDTGKLHLVQLYKEQVGAKIINSIHSVIAAWVVIALLCLVSRSPFHRAHSSPLIIGAFATEAVVSFFAYRTPLAQPKNILMGNTISAIVGVAMQKAFAGTNYSVQGVFGIDWAVAATTVSAAVFAMQILGFTHPPGAAVALLAVTNVETHNFDWWLVPIVIIGSLIVIGWAMVINNVGGRSYPANWFYLHAFAETPIIGPEKLPFSNSPYEPPPSRHPRNRKRKRIQQATSEKGFYRDSGAKVPQGFGRIAEPKPRAKAAPPTTAAARTTGQTLGAAGAASQQVAPAASKFEFGTGAMVAYRSAANAGAAAAAEDGRMTRASQVTKVDSANSNADAGAGAGAVPSMPTSTSAGTATMKPSEAEKKSRMIEDTTAISRNNSKSSKRSRRSIQVHVNENRRHSTGSHPKAPPVPAIQWRGPE